MRLSFFAHPVFNSVATKMAPDRVTDVSPEGLAASSPKENHSKESQLEESSGFLATPPLPIDSAILGLLMIFLIG